VAKEQSFGLPQYQLFKLRQVLLFMICLLVHISFFGSTYCISIVRFVARLSLTRRGKPLVK
jgi:hypothetical protein